MKKSKYLILLITIVFIGCLFTNSDGNKINGRLVYNNNNLSDAIVIIDTSNWMDISSNEGNFSISGITEGSHTLVALKNLNGDSYTRLDTIITVGSGTNELGTFELYQPVELIDFDEDETNENEVIVRWNKTNTDGFLKYELIRYINNFNGDNMEEIIFESENANDSSYTDQNIYTDLESYYRLITYFNSGKSTGSKIRSIICHEPPLKNGNFEEKTPDIYNIPSWGYNRFFRLDSLTVAEGNFSLKGIMNENTISRVISIEQEILVGDIKGGEKYLISAKMKSINNAVLYVTIFYDTPSLYREGLANLSNYGINDWVDRSTEIILPQDISILRIRIAVLVPDNVIGYGNFNGAGYFDDIKLTIIK